MQLVYAAQLRTVSIADRGKIYSYDTIEGPDFVLNFTDSIWDTQTLMQALNFQAVQAGLAALRNALSQPEGSDSDMRPSSVSSLNATVSMIGELSAKVCTMVNVRFVPAFNYQFYSTKMQEYFDAFNTETSKFVQAAGEQAEVVLEYNELKITDTQLNGDSSVTKVSQEMTWQTVTAALSGMGAALSGLKHTGTMMNVTAMKLEADLKAYQEEQEKARRRAMIFGCISLGLQVVSGGLNAYASFNAIGSESAKAKNAGGQYRPWRNDAQIKDTETYVATWDGKYKKEKTGGKDDSAYWKAQETGQKGSYYAAKGTDSFIKSCSGVTSSSMAIANMDKKGDIDQSGNIAVPEGVASLARQNVAFMEDAYGWNTTTMLLPSTDDPIADLSLSAWVLNQILPQACHVDAPLYATPRQAPTTHSLAHRWAQAFGRNTTPTVPNISLHHRLQHRNQHGCAQMARHPKGAVRLRRAVLPLSPSICGLRLTTKTVVR